MHGTEVQRLLSRVRPSPTFSATPALFALVHSDHPMPPIVSLTVFGLSAILRPMRVLSVIVLLTTLNFPTIAIAEVKTITATHTYVMGDHESKEDVRQ